MKNPNGYIVCFGLSMLLSACVGQMKTANNSSAESSQGLANNNQSQTLTASPIFQSGPPPETPAPTPAPVAAPTPSPSSGSSGSGSGGSCPSGGSPSNVATLNSAVQATNSSATTTGNLRGSMDVIQASCQYTYAGFVATANGSTNPSTSAKDAAIGANCNGSPNAGTPVSMPTPQTNSQHSSSLTPIPTINSSFAQSSTQAQSSQVAFVADGFELDNLRGNGITSTDLCAAGTSLPCSPSSSGFVMEIQWSSNGSAISNVLLANGTNVSAADLSCSGGSQLQSPLVIEDSPGQGIVTLNPVATDTYFDLTGDGTKDRISCVKSGSFLALPNEAGQIQNINQLFGNNTVGPDGKKAANGFLALAKYDANHDGFITARDPIFSKLVLWQDANCDGIAQANEINPLASTQITAIKVANTVVMHEVDAYGNTTEQRNSVQLSYGAVERIFDLWFKIY